ncbi:hypothetical protein LL946_16225 [Knoellia locipacati]|uniref:hypothetical protein n=1 Tax=Knoellia locipacati TaxID=882824 RepID=UPI00384E6FF4
MSVRAVLVGVVVGATVLTAGCTAGSDATSRTPTPATASLDWARVDLPEGLAPVTLATSEGSVVVGAIGPSRPRPRLLVGPDAQSLREVPLTPASPYAFEARWFQVAMHGDRIDAVAGARGGAHGNYRWSTWSGDASGVAEQEQPFGVFGSYGAGDLAGIAYAGGAPVVLGAWQSEQTGMDIATWTRKGDRWSRVPSTGTPLGSTPRELVDARTVTSRGDGLLLVGSVTHLEPGSVEVMPAAWTSDGPDGPWTRVDLPRMGDTGTSEVDGARCDGDRCVLAGVTDGHLSVWEVRPDSQSQLAGIPALELPENATIPSPVTVGDDDVVVAPDGSGSAVLRLSGTSWTTAPGPQGAPTWVVAHGGELWVVTTDARGSTTLWRSRVA